MHFIMIKCFKKVLNPNAQIQHKFDNIVVFHNFDFLKCLISPHNASNYLYTSTSTTTNSLHSITKNSSIVKIEGDNYAVSTTVTYEVTQR